LTDQLLQPAPEERPETRIHRIALIAAGDGLLSAEADFRPAGNILSILLILSKNLFFCLCAFDPFFHFILDI